MNTFEQSEEEDEGKNTTKFRTEKRPESNENGE